VLVGHFTEREHGETPLASNCYIEHEKGKARVCGEDPSLRPPTDLFKRPLASPQLFEQGGEPMLPGNARSMEGVYGERGEKACTLENRARGSFALYPLNTLQAGAAIEATKKERRGCGT